MARTWVSCLLALLVAMQSVIAMAADHQIHATENQHVVYSELDRHVSTHQSSHCENDNAQFENDNETDSLLSAFDCPHCCHTHTDLSDNFSQTLGDFLESGNSNYQFTDLSFLTTPDHRPPILKS